MKFNEKIARLRKETNITQESLAEKIGVSRQSIAKWESGEAFPEVEKLILVSRYFAASIDSLVKDDEDCAAGKNAVSGERAAHGEMTAFLCRGKKATYAGHGAETASCRPGSHDLSYREGSLLYYDTYFGGERFIGEEAIWDGEVPYWAMNYSGRVLGEGFSGDFLKEALSGVTADMPYRGPRFFQRGQYAYQCMVDGSFDWYSGREEICLDSRKIFECVFHGGIVR